jgi:acyl carrier protein
VTNLSETLTTPDHKIDDEESIRNTIRELIVALAPSQSVTGFSAEHRLVEDLNYHSLALLELAFTLEDEFALDPMDEQQALKIVSAGDIERHVIEELRRKHASGDAAAQLQS